MPVVAELTVAEALEQIVFAGVAMTTVAIARARPDFELTFPQWRVLVVLGAAPAGLRIGEVARRVGVTFPATSRQLHRLERRGLIDLRPDDDDRRASRVQLTPSGREVLDATVAHRRARLQEIAAPFESDPALRDHLARVAAALTSGG